MKIFTVLFYLLLPKLGPETVISVAAVVVSFTACTRPCHSAWGLPLLGLKLWSRTTENGVIGGSVLAAKKCMIPVWDEKLCHDLTSP